MGQADQTHGESTTTNSRGYLGLVFALYQKLQVFLLYHINQLTTSYQQFKTPGKRIDNFFQTRLDGPTYKLLQSMGLPLVDGAYASIVMAGTLASVNGMLITGATILGGSWMVTIIFNEMHGDSISERLRRISVVVMIVLPIVIIETMIAPMIVSLIDLSVFKWFSVAVIMTVGAFIANDEFEPLMAYIKHIVVVGLVVSLISSALASGTVEFDIIARPMLVGRAVLTLGMSVTMAITVAVIGPQLEEWIKMSVFSTGAGISLILVAAGLLGWVPKIASLAVFMVALGVAVNPNQSGGY